MSGFGKRGGGGRREAARFNANLSAVVKRRLSTHLAEIIDVSTTGAKVLCEGLLKFGEEIEVAVERLEFFGTVVWADGDAFGVDFETPISNFELATLQHVVSKARLERLNPAQHEALEIWRVGRVD